MKLIKTIFVPMIIKSQNAFTFSAGKKFNYVYTNYRDKFYKELDKAFDKKDHPEDRPNTKRYIKLVNKKKGRKYDEGNLKGGAKPILDYLKNNNWIYDDSPQWVECDIDQFQIKKHKNHVGDQSGVQTEGVEINIYDIENESKTMYYRHVVGNAVVEFGPVEFSGIHDLLAFISQEGGDVRIVERFFKDDEHFSVLKQYRGNIACKENKYII